MFLGNTPTLIFMSKIHKMRPNFHKNGLFISLTGELHGIDCCMFYVLVFFALSPAAGVVSSTAGR